MGEHNTLEVVSFHQLEAMSLYLDKFEVIRLRSGSAALHQNEENDIPCQKDKWTYGYHWSVDPESP